MATPCRAEIWQNLASFEIGTLQPVSLTDNISNLVELLSISTDIAGFLSTNQKN
ncbi:hypothetical protein LC593_25490 [Nostoc sp. CHAB 5844]|nr:hypothetical protein [Nostoc sp. CHAB 5844]